MKTPIVDDSVMFPLRVEHLFRRVLGDPKYDNTASAFTNPRYFKEQIKKLIKQLHKDIDELQASELFINSAKYNLENLQAAINRGDFSHNWQQITIASLEIVANFLGYEAGSKRKIVEPYFIPSVWQESKNLDMLDQMDRMNKLRVDYRLEIVVQLKSRGLTHAEIAEVMNQTGYRIAQLLNKAKVKKRGQK